MTEEMVESKRLTLDDVDRSKLSGLVNGLSDTRGQLGQHTMTVRALRAQFEALLEQKAQEEQELASRIDQAAESLQGFSRELMERYEVDANDGAWSLNVVEGCFIQQKPVSEVETEKPKRTRRTKKATKSKAAPRKAAKKTRKRKTSTK